MSIIYLTLAAIVVAAIVLAIGAYNRNSLLIGLAAAVATFLVVVLAILLFSNNLAQITNSSVPSAPQSEQTALPVEEEKTKAPVEEGLSPLEVIQQFFGHDLAENHFTTVGIPGCAPVNAEWRKLFTYGDAYMIDRTNGIFPAGHLIVFEGVITGTDPLHTVMVLTGTVFADQANVWDCGVATGLTPEVIHTLVFEFADKKYQDQTAQKLSKPYQIVTPFGTYNYADGQKPAWSPTVEDVAAPVCPFATPSLSDPAGVPTAGGFVGAPGKVGCDFVIVFPGGQTAIRYHNAIDSFFYPTGSHFYLFDPKMDNASVSAAIPGQPAIENSWK